MTSGKTAFLTAAIACLATAVTARAGVFRTIVVDGNVTDWTGIAPAFTDASGDSAPNSSGQTVDFTNVYVANDANYLYFRYQLAQPADPTTFQSNYFLNTDGNAGTGYGGGGGSELLIQGTGVFQENSGGFNDGALDPANTQIMVSNGGGTDSYEYRISRAATFNNGNPVFTSDTISLLLETDAASGAPADYAGPVSYTFADAATAPEPASLSLLALSALPMLRRRRA